MIREATISPCGKYRYTLYRRWALGPTAADAKPILWVMLNPSTADHRTDDRTIGRCVEFSKRWGHSSLYVANLYAWRTTYPHELRQIDETTARGPENASYIEYLVGRSALVVCAWGGSVKHLIETRMQLWPVKEAWCLGKTKSGEPLHPLYLRGDTQLQRYIL
jgi:hypothetical protein